jgi:predicted transcriptional regulator
MGKKIPPPTEAELAILQALWKCGPSTVKEVQAELAEGTGYTTVLKQLQIMTEKGLVLRDEANRAHVYQASLAKEQTQQTLLGGVLDRVFLGSASELVLRALSSRRATPQELKEIRALVDRLAKEGDK